MDQPIIGLDKAINDLSLFCYTRMTITLNAENYRATNFDAVRAADGSILVTGYGFEIPSSLLEDTPIRQKLIKWVKGNTYIVVIACSYTADIDPLTKLNKKEIRGFIVHLNNETNTLTYERMSKEDLIRSRSLDPHTGEPVEPSSDEIYL